MINHHDILRLLPHHCHSDQENGWDRFVWIYFCDQLKHTKQDLLLMRSLDKNENDTHITLFEYLSINEDSICGYNICQKAILSATTLTLFIDNDTHSMVIIDLQNLTLKQTDIKHLTTILAGKLECKSREQSRPELT